MMGNRAIIVLGIVAGFFVVSFAANYAPTFVNGVLLLILIGTLLGNADRWLPMFTHFGAAVDDALARRNAAGGILYGGGNTTKGT